MVLKLVIYVYTRIYIFFFYDNIIVLFSLLTEKIKVCKNTWRLSEIPCDYNLMGK